MAKRSREDVKEDEKKILEELMKDSSQGPNPIAEKLGFSRQKVWRIINRLEEEGIIWGYSAVVDREKRNQNKFFFLVDSNQHQMDLSVLEDAEEFNVSVDDAVYTHGTVDWIISLTAECIEDAIVFGNYLQRKNNVNISICRGLYVKREQNQDNPDEGKLWKKMQV